MSDNTKAATEVTASVSAGVAPDGVAPETVADESSPSIPQIGGYMTEKHAYYFNGQGPVPSVTTILGILDKPAVGMFKAKEAARAIYRQLWLYPGDSDYAEAEMGSEEEAIKWALQEADKARDTAAELGSSVHLLADLVGASEADSTGFGVGSDTFPYLEAYRHFLARYGRDSIVSSEHMVWSLNGYAGTYDLMMRLSHLVGCRYEPCLHDAGAPELWLIDIKTSGKGPYPEWALQLAGYRWADGIMVPGTPGLYPMPQIQRTGVLHLRPDLYPDTGWRLIEYPTSYDLDYIPFLGALELLRWKQSGRFTKSKLLGRKR